MWVTSSGNSASQGTQPTQGVPFTASTLVMAETVDQQEIHYTLTKGGRQALNVQNSALDMRYHFAQGYDADSFSKAIAPKNFQPAGSGGSFGYLSWLYNNEFASGPFMHYSANGGIAREHSDMDGEVPDPRDPNLFNESTGVYYRYDSTLARYFYYTGGDPQLGAVYVAVDVDRLGYSLYYNYNGSGQLVSITGAVGQLTPYFAYDANGHVTTMYLQDANGSDSRTTYYSYDVNGGMSAILEPENVATYFGIANTTQNPWMDHEVDPDGFVTYFYYINTVPDHDRIGTLNHAGRITYFNDTPGIGDSTGLFSNANLNNGATRNYVRNQLHLLHAYNVTQESLSIDSTNLSTTYYQYDPTSKRLSARMDANGNVTYFSRNHIFLRSRIETADGSTMYFRYATGGRDVTTEVGRRQTISFFQTTYYGYDSTGFGLLTQKLDPLKNATYYGYDALKRRVQMLDPLNNATYYGYDIYNRLTAIQDALANTTYYAYNANAQTTGLENARGQTWYYTYDKLDQQTSQQLPTGELTTFGYNGRGLEIREGRPGGRATYFDYDAYKNKTRQTQVLANGLSTTYWQFDDQDNQVAMIDPDNNRTEYGYDLRRSRIKSKDALGNAWYFAYDAVGNQTRAEDPNLHTAYFGFDNRNRNSSILREGTNAVYYTYDFDSNRTAVTNERGFTTYYGFDALDRQIATLDPLSDATYFGYDANGNRVSVVDPRGFVTYYGYDPVNRQSRMLDALNRATYYGYDAVGNRTAQLYANNTTTYFGYDGSNRLIAKEDQASFTTYYGFDVAGNQNRIVDPRGDVTYFQFDLMDRQTATLDALNESTYYGYDPASNRTSQTDHVVGSSSATTYFGYDALNRLVRQQDALNRTTYYTYDAVGNQLSVTAPGTPPETTYFGYDSLNRVVQTLTPYNSATYYGYDATSNRSQVLNPRGFAAYFGYDALNRPSQTLDALNGSTYYVYDADGDLLRQRDVRGFWTYFQYDAVDRLTQTTDAAGGLTQRQYDLVDNLAVLQPPSGNAAYFYYEPRNLLSVGVDGVGDVTYYGYDAAGNRSATTSARGFTSYFGYDKLNRLSQVLDAVGGTTYFGFDVGGNTARVVDPLSRTTYFTYDVLDRLTSVLDPLLNAVYFGYDQAGNRAREEDARQNTTYYAYDVGNRLAAVLDPLNNAAYYGYDANSNLAQTLDNNRTAIYFGYDALDRRTRIQYPAENQYFGYDAGGNLTATQDAWGNSYFGYDALSRLVQRVTPNQDAVYYAYDPASNLLALQYPRDGKTCYYGYDGAQRMTRALSPNLNTTYWTYDSDSDVSKKILGNGVISWATFDKMDRIISLRYTKSDGTAITYFDYSRDVSGRINIINREPAAGYAIYYSYDLDDRLVGEYWRKQSDNSQVYAFTYQYDPAGNRLAMRRESTAGTQLESAYYSYAADNSLTQRFVQPAGNSTYWQYDSNGNTVVVSDSVAGATYFGYGPHQLITRIAPPPTVEAPSYFFYDSRLNRYCENRAGAITYFLWDGPNLLEERNSDGSLKVRYSHGYTQIPGIGSTIEAQRIVGSATYFQYMCMDHRGTVYTVTDSNQNIQLSYTTDAFGRQLSGIGGSTPTVPNELIYQTNWRTPIVGGQYYWLSPSRIGDPALGRFLGRDPLPNDAKVYRSSTGRSLGIYIKTKFARQIAEATFNGSLAATIINCYQYAKGNPTGLIDHLGLREIPVDFKAFIGSTHTGPLGWFVEPHDWATPFTGAWQLHGDERGFGQNGSSRVRSWAKIESTLLGRHPRADNQNSGTIVGVSSARRQKWTVWDGTFWQEQFARAKATSIREIINTGLCETTVRLQATAADPLVFASPNISYDVKFVLTAIPPNQVWISVSGEHDRFPDYEALVDNSDVYTYLAGSPLSILNPFPLLFGPKFVLVAAPTPPWCLCSLPPSTPPTSSPSSSTTA